MNCENMMFVPSELMPELKLCQEQIERLEGRCIRLFWNIIQKKEDENTDDK